MVDLEVGQQEIKKKEEEEEEGKQIYYKIDCGNAFPMRIG